MSLFAVKGWDVPSNAVTTASPSRKRKRQPNESDKVQSAQVNIEKLMRKVEKDSLESTHDSKKKKKDKKGKGKEKGSNDGRYQGTKLIHHTSKKHKIRMSDAAESTTNPGETSAVASTRPSKRARKKASRDLTAVPATQNAMQGTLSDSTPNKKPSHKPNISAGLTSLQSSMKGSLDGARFRWINEVLYTATSEDGHNLMREDPNLYEEYHTGFRQQVRSWPSNPIDHYIKSLSSYPQGTVIADLGCGDAALAKTLAPKGYCVLSFDLVSDGMFILEANICENIPLPGSEESHTGGSQGQIVDVCVCALSLMSLDWIQCIRETWRILRIGGELKIAEVTSRFTDVDQFISVIKSVGFRFKAKNDSNTHFTLFEFEKVLRDPPNDQTWEDLRVKHTILKPCEYKRR